jgi:hypothetical protein
MLDALSGIAVFTEDRELFNHTFALWRARLPAYFWSVADPGGKPVPPRGRPSWYGQVTFNASVDGVCQETCRDMGHTQMGLASALYAAETASIQGVDLLGEAQPRVVAALEFHARLLLLNDSAMPAYVCAGAGVHLSYPPTFDVAYEQYHRRRNVSLPLTKQHLARTVRPMADPVAGHIFVYESLNHGGELFKFYKL